jgi:hypothetical protein
MPHIVILVHRDGALDDSKYFLHEIARLWEADGIRVTVQRGPGPVHRADLCISHVDLTVVPADHLAYLRVYPRVLNGSVADISKRKISTAVLHRRDAFDGPVVVKTNRNSGGLREARLARRSPLPRLTARLRNRLPWSMRSALATPDYPVFPSAAHVPRAVWFNPDLVVERFLSERSGEHYCLRTWVFLGNRQTHSLSFSASPIVKQCNILRREPIDQVPPELQKIRGDLGFDFGKFDYGIVDGNVVLYDVNRTPTLGNFSREQFLPRLRMLAEGIRCFL